MRQPSNKLDERAREIKEKLDVVKEHITIALTPQVTRDKDTSSNSSARTCRRRYANWCLLSLDRHRAMTPFKLFTENEPISVVLEDQADDEPIEVAYGEVEKKFKSNERKRKSGCHRHYSDDLIAYLENNKGSVLTLAAAINEWTESEAFQTFRRKFGRGEAKTLEAFRETLDKQLWMAILAEFLVVQKKMAEQQEEPKYQRIIDRLDIECRHYQQRLAAILDAQSDAVFAIDQANGVRSYQLCALVAGQSYDAINRKKLQITLQKYNKLLELRQILGIPKVKPELKPSLRYEAFSAAYSKPETCRLLQANTDSFWKVFFKNVAYLLYSVITLGQHFGIKKRHMTHFWKPPIPENLVTIETILTRTMGCR